MTISEIKKWAKAQGYTIIKDKGDEEKDEPVQYYWSKDNDINATGVAPSVSKVAKAIFNHITEYRWIDHQNAYEENKTYNYFNINGW
jgi:hypothetical protein